MNLRTLTEKPAVLAIVLACGAFLLYAPSLGGEFVYDSRAQIMTDGYVHEPRHFVDVLTLSIMHEDTLDNNRPVSVLSYMIDSLFYGRAPFGYHLTNVLLHAATVVLLFLFCRTITGTAGAFGASLLFAVHPLTCEVVAEVSNRKDALSALAILLGLWLATRFRPGRYLIAAGCVLCLFLAVGAKEAGAAGPVALTAYWLLFRRNEPVRPWLALVLAAWAVVTAFMVARFLLPPQDSLIFHDKPGALDPSIARRLLIQVRIWVFEIRQIFWPLWLCPDYNPYSLRNFVLGWSSIILAVFLALQITLAVMRRAAAFGFVLFWAALLPASNIIPIYCPIADRFLYIPLCGLAISIAAFIPRAGRRAAIAVAACVALSIPLGYLTLQRERLWHDAYALWQDGLRQNPTSLQALSGFGAAEVRAGHPEKAIPYFNRLVSMTNGKFAPAFAGLALASEAMGDHFNADLYFHDTIFLDTRYADPVISRKAIVFEIDELPVWDAIIRRNTPHH